MYRELDLSDTVTFEGHNPNISTAYREADITVQSSVSEAFPYSVIESMMSGVPMVATDVGGTREALGTTGILVPSRNPEALAEAIRQLAVDPDRRRALGLQARARALQHFEISTAMMAFLNLYREWQSKTPSVEPTPILADAALLHVTRALLLQRLNATEPALAEYHAALSELANHAASIPLLYAAASLELKVGRETDAYRHMLKSRLLELVFERSPREAS